MCKINNTNFKIHNEEMILRNLSEALQHNNDNKQMNTIFY